MTTLKTLNETQLVIQYQDTKASEIIGELYNRYQDNVISFCYKRIQDWDLAKDLTQDIFIKISQKLSQLKEPHAFLKWMYQIARNACMDYLRANKKRKMTDLSEIENLCEMEDEYDEAVRKEEMIKSVNILLDNIEPLSKTLLLEKYYGKKTIVDLSTEYGLSNSAVKMRLLRTKRRVESMMEKRTLAVA